MNRKIIQILWIKSIIAIIWLFSSLSTFAYATWEVSIVDLKNSVMLTTDDNALINAAVSRVSKLQDDIETIKEELSKLDEEQRNKNSDMSTNYKQARFEMVKVISSIKWTSETLSWSLEKLTQYQKKMKDLLKQLRDAEVSEKKAKEYMDEYMTLLYKMQLKIYDQDGENIDDIRLFVNSDNFNETFIWNDLLSAMTSSTVIMIIRPLLRIRS